MLPTSVAAILAGYGFPPMSVSIHRSPGVETTWTKQIANPQDFEILYVAALRSTGWQDARPIAEFWTGEKWQTAPEPIVMTLLSAEEQGSPR